MYTVLLVFFACYLFVTLSLLFLFALSSLLQRNQHSSSQDFAFSQETPFLIRKEERIHTKSSCPTSIYLTSYN